jgi:hypothetical protein
MYRWMVAPASIAKGTAMGGAEQNGMFTLLGKDTAS